MGAKQPPRPHRHPVPRLVRQGARSALLSALSTLQTVEHHLSGLAGALDAGGGNLRSNSALASVSASVPRVWPSPLQARHLKYHDRSMLPVPSQHLQRSASGMPAARCASISVARLMSDHLTHKLLSARLPRLLLCCQVAGASCDPHQRRTMLADIAHSRTGRALDRQLV